MTTWIESTGSNRDIIYPHGDFDAANDLNAFWATSLSSVTTVEVSSVAIVSGALKVIATSSSTDCKYTKAIPVVIGGSYTIAGSSTAAADSTVIKGGSTSGGNEYFQLFIGTSGLPDTFAEDLSSGALTFTTTTDTLYLQVHMTDPSDHISIDDISLTGPVPPGEINTTWKSTELMQYGFATWSGIGYNWEASLSAFVNSPTTQHDESSGKWEDLE